MNTKQAVRNAAVVVLLMSVGGCTGIPGSSTSDTETAPAGSKPAPGELVAIVVVDDFDVPTDQKYSTKLTADDNCLVTSRKAQVARAQGATGDDLPDGVSHGDMVLTAAMTELDAAHLTDTVPEAKKDDFGLDQTWVRRLSLWTSGSDHKPAVLLVGVDTDDYETGEISSRLKVVTSSATHPEQGAAKSKPPITRFVLNLSFEVLPCKWLVDGNVELGPEALRLAYLQFLASSDDSRKFDQLKSDLAGLAGVRDEKTLKAQIDAFDDLMVRDVLSKTLTGAAEALRAKISTLALSGDALAQQIGELTSNDGLTVIPVAAAGNGIGSDHLALQWPSIPAQWNSVVSASASGGDYSNAGEVKADGTVSLEANGKMYELRGTSFAAPRISVKEAVYLLSGGVVPCQGRDHRMVAPPLAYTDSDAGRVNWENLSIDQASDRYCAGLADAKVP